MGGLTTILQLAHLVFGTVNQVPLPHIDLNEWWGPGKAPAEQNTSISKFEIKFTDEMTSDLICRLENHRPFTPPLEGIAQQYGFNSDLLVQLTKYLANEYPFKKREVFLNQFPHFKTCLQGICLHFIRVKSQNEKVLKKTNSRYTPLLLLHGWPGSVREFYEAIPLIISLGESRGIAFDIIVPSLPGFGFSSAATKPGLGMDKCAVLLRNFMHRIGYSKYYIQGGDVGATIATCMSTLFQDEVLGFHSNLPAVHTPEIFFQLILGILHPTEITTLNLLTRIYPLTVKLLEFITMSGFMHIQATKPDTVSAGLTDSPAGLIAYTLEKVSAGLRKKFINAPDGGLTAILKPEQIFDNFMVYWSSNSINTAIRLYAETFNMRFLALRINDIKSTVPMWVLQAPDEILYLPPWMIKKKYVNLLGETLPREGGHFFAWEQPRPFAEDVVKAVVAFEEFHARNTTMYAQCAAYFAN